MRYYSLCLLSLGIGMVRTEPAFALARCQSPEDRRLDLTEQNPAPTGKPLYHRLIRPPPAHDAREHGSGPKTVRTDSIYVPGYFRSDGTYVPPHVRSAPDEYRWNNFGPSQEPFESMNPYARDWDSDGSSNTFDFDDDNDGVSDDFDRNQYGY